jgi:GT2 family glycosyltransferase
MISILLAAYKSKDLLMNVFYPSFYNNCKEDVELIVYDNGNDFPQHISASIHPIDGTFQMNTGREIKFKLIGDGKNIGLNAALNECAKAASGEWFFLPHTDMYLMPGWDTALLEAVKNRPPQRLLLCSRSIEPTKGHTDYHIIKNYGMEWNEFEKKKLLEDFSGYVDRGIVSGYRMPFFLHEKLWRRMGGVDPNYFSYCTDDDLVQEAYDAGVRQFWMVNDSLVYHLQGKSNQQQTVDKDSNKPYEYFVKKWRDRGYKDAQHPAYWHPKLIPWYQRVR